MRGISPVPPSRSSSPCLSCCSRSDGWLFGSCQRASISLVRPARPGHVRRPHLTEESHDTTACYGGAAHRPCQRDRASARRDRDPGAPDGGGDRLAARPGLRAPHHVRRAEAVVLSPPLPAGIWLAGDGPSNDSPHRRALAALAGRTYIAQRFAIDWMLVGPNGDTHRDDATRNENYWGFDQPVFAVADGEVMEVVDSIADHAPHVLPGAVTLANIAGNHVILRIAPHRYVLYGHLEHGSVRVCPGERVRRGQTIAKLGDSGQATAPHLHLDVVDGNSVLGAEGVP